MNELDEKTERLTRLADKNELGGILLTSQPGFAWLTSGGTNRIDGSRENGSGALFVRADGRRYVIANTIEMPRLVAEELTDGRWEPVEYPWTDDHAKPDALVTLARSLVRGDDAIGSDLPIQGAMQMDRALMRTRTLLTDDEIARYRRLGREAGSVIGSLAAGLEPGLDETSVAQLVHAAAGSIGGRAVVVLIAADDRIARFRHPVATSARWKRLLMIVTCIQRAGLVVALSRIVSAGKPPEELKRRTDATASVFNALVDATVAGAIGSVLFAVAQRAYEAVGFAGEETKHHQGGAIGYRSREWIAHPGSDETVQARQAFAWNPSITGTKVEDTALVTENGPELITSSPEWPTLRNGAAGILTI